MASAEFKVFNNKISKKFIKKAEKFRNRFLRMYKTELEGNFVLSSRFNTYIGPYLGVRNIVNSPEGEEIDANKGIVVGTIRMGFGHYRMSMALASAAHALGYTPYWLDLLSFEGTAAARIIRDLDWLYSMASRVSQQFTLFNKLFWEKATSEMARKLSYYVRDLKLTELFATICQSLPKHIPFVSSHPWAAQAALHSDIKNVITMIPDNWPMAFHLAEGSVHTVQTPSAYLGYRTLRNMGMKEDDILNPIPDEQIWYTGHYVDHEIVKNIEKDCEKRLHRVRRGSAKRILLTMGGAAAELQKYEKISQFLYPLAKEKKIILYINMGDHSKRWTELKKVFDKNGMEYELHSNWEKTCEFARMSHKKDLFGVHVFLHDQVFPAVYTTNLLMRSVDILVTKPSELSFYPVPKLFIQRVGRHEAWGAIRGAEIGDSTLETKSLPHVFQTLKLMINENDLIPFYCDNIVKNKKSGIYDGAYNVVKLAMERKKALEETTATVKP